jgi:lipopolysaccharide export system protein LptA
MTLNAPRAEYDGVSRVATASSGVTLQEENATLRAGSGSYRMYERVAYFSDGVTLEDGKAKLTAAAGEYYSLEKRAVFRGNVNVLSDSGRIRAEQLTYWRESQEAFATGNVTLLPKGQNARLTGDTLRNIPARNYTLVLGHPKLVQIDTTRADSTGEIRRDTTTITARMLEAFRGTTAEYRATDNVRLNRGDLQAVSRIARYLPDDSVIALGSGVARKRADTGNAAPKDSLSGNRAVTGVRKDTSAGETSPLMASPIVWYGKSQLTGDTITVGLSDRRLRAIDVTGNAFAVTEGERRGRYDQLAGERLYFDVLEDTIRYVRSEGLASSIYFLYDAGNPNGLNRASGDTIGIAFDAGQVSRIRIRGKRNRAEGEYFPEAQVAGQEGGFRLEGFRWVGRDGGTNPPSPDDRPGSSQVLSPSDNTPKAGDRGTPAKKRSGKP